MKKGFTLIELLVVIAIIGILASVVLIGFPNATRKAKDSRVIAAIGQARTIMTYIGANDGTYAAFTPTHVDMGVLWAEITTNDRDPSTAPAPAAIGGTEPQGACIYAQLNAKDNWWYCADATGVAGFAVTNPGVAGECLAPSFECPAVTG